MGSWRANLPGRDLDVLHLALRHRDFQAVFAHALEMEFDGLADVDLDILDGDPRCNTAGKIRDVG